jgi:serine/threonine protein kinase
LVDGERVFEEKTYPLVGETLDRYQIVAPIGEGAMGCVYRGTHTVLPREYAIKVLFRDFAGNATQIERFRREAQAASTMSHANIVQVADFVSLQNGITFIVMELIAGHTLEAAIHAQAPFPPKRVGHIARQIAAGLGEAHRMGFVHRDVKPSNIMLSPSPKGEHVKILDFGVVGIGQAPIASRLTGIGHIIGTPTYMAPEQVHDPSVGPAADLYALGVIMFEMLAGEPPFTGVDRTEVFIKHISEPPPSLPPAQGLELLVSSLLEKQPEKRPKRADEVIRSIERLNLSEESSPNTADITLRPPVRAPSTVLDLDTDSSLPGEVVRRELADTDPEKRMRSSDDMFPSLAHATGHNSGEWASWDPDGSYASLKPLDHHDTMPIPPPDGRPPIADPSDKLEVPPTQIVRARDRPPVVSEDFARSFDPPTDLLYYDEPELPNPDVMRTRPNAVDEGPTQVDFDLNAVSRDTIPADGRTKSIPTPVVMVPDGDPTEATLAPAIGKIPTDDAIDLRHVATVLDSDTLDEPMESADGFEEDPDPSVPLVKPLRAPEIPAIDDAVEGLRHAESQTEDTIEPLVFSGKTRTDLELQPAPVRSSNEIDGGILDRRKAPVIAAFLIGILFIAIVLWMIRTWFSG